MTRVCSPKASGENAIQSNPSNPSCPFRCLLFSEKRRHELQQEQTTKWWQVAMSINDSENNPGPRHHTHNI